MKQVFAVQGMTCQACARAVTRVVAGLPGARAVRVDLDRGRAEVEGEVSVTDVVRAIEQAGYRADPLDVA